MAVFPAVVATLIWITDSFDNAKMLEIVFKDGFYKYLGNPSKKKGRGGGAD